MIRRLFYKLRPIGFGLICMTLFWSIAAILPSNQLSQTAYASATYRTQTTTGISSLPNQPTLRAQQNIDHQGSPKEITADAIIRVAPVAGGTTGSIAIPVTATIPVNNFSTASLEIRYDPAVLDATGCTADPNNAFDIKFCNISADNDNVNPDFVKFNDVSFVGVSGDLFLAEIIFDVIGTVEQTHLFEVVVSEFADTDGNAVPYEIATPAASYDFQTSINGQDADSLDEALLVDAGNSLTFRYTMSNTGEIDVEWTTLADDVFDSIANLTALCQLPQTIAPNGHYTCEFTSPAGDYPEGKRSIGTVTVTGLNPQTDSAWYRTALNQSYLFEKMINDLPVDTLEEALLVEPKDAISYKFVVTNTGNADLEWTMLSDDVFDSLIDLTQECELPRTISGPGGVAFCELIVAAGDHPQGHRNIATAEITGLDNQQDSAWYRTPANPSFTFNKAINGNDANSLAEAHQAEIGATLLFEYRVNNTGNVTITWDSLTDDVFGDLSAECQLPIAVPVSEAKICQISRQADVAPDGKKNIGTAEVMGLEAQSDDAWYQTSGGASIGDFVWDDLDGNGVQDAGEPGVPDVSIALLDGVGATIDTTQSDANGLYVFTNMLSGTYGIRFVVPSGYDGFTKQDAGSDDTIDSDIDATVGSPTFGQTAPFTLTDQVNASSLDVGLYKFGRLGDSVWEDLNGDGIQDQGEPGLADVTVNLLNSENAVIETTITDADGAYLFTQIIPGLYAIQVAKDGYAFTLKDQGADDALDSDVSPISGISNPVAVRSGENDDMVDAGMYPDSTSIAGIVWNDTDQSGLQNGDEGGLSGIVVRLLDENGGQIRSLETVEDGSYQFDKLTPGSYIVQFQKPNGYKFTEANQGNDDANDSDADPISGETVAIPLLPGQNLTDIDAGLSKLGSIGDFVWVDDNADGIRDSGELGIGELGLGDVSVQLLNSNEQVVAQTDTDSAGFYLFENLEAGSYLVVFGNLPANFLFSPQDQGSDESKDSDADATGRTDPISLSAGENKVEIDAGLVREQPAIDVQKLTNDEDADEAPGVIVTQGDPIIWTYIVKNIGNFPLTQIVLTDDKEGTISCPRVELGINEEMSCTATGTAQIGQYVNEAEVVAEVEGQSGGTVRAIDQSHYIGNNADLSIVKSDSADPTKPGDALTYTLEYTNNGPSDAENVIITDRLPYGLLFNSIISQDNSLNDPTVVPPENLNQGQQLVWVIETLPAGATGTIEFMVDTDLNLGGADLVNEVEIKSDTPDANLENNADSEMTTFYISGVNVCCPTAIQVLSFFAQEEDQQIQVRWVTAAEVDTVGFDLYRDEAKDFDLAQRITPAVIPAKSSLGSEYIYTDTTAQEDISYNYWLVEVQSSDEQIFGPVSAQLQTATIVTMDNSNNSNNAQFIFLPLVQR